MSPDVQTTGSRNGKKLQELGLKASERLYGACLAAEYRSLAMFSQSLSSSLILLNQQVQFDFSQLNSNLAFSLDLTLFSLTY